MKKLKKVLSGALCLSMAMSLFSVNAFAAATETTTKVYQGTATVEPDDMGQFDAYNITVQVTEVNGVITDVDYYNTQFSGNETYANYAMKGRPVKNLKGIAEQIITQNSLTGEFDTVTGATCSSDAIMEAVQNAQLVSTNTTVDKTDLKALIDEVSALNNDEGTYTASSWRNFDSARDDAAGVYSNDNATAAEADAAESALRTAKEKLVINEPVYVTMNIPYGDFYANEGVSEQVDVISTATTSKFLGTTGLAKGTYNDGTNICGVTYPVLMDTDTYNTLKAQLDEENTSADYYFVDCEETPAAYKILTYADGKYSFSDAKGTQKSAEGLSVTEFTTESSYGNYQITLNGVGTNGTINGETYSNIAGVILTTSDGVSYPMYTLENTWFGTRIDYVEVAWSVKDAPEVYKAHGSGPAFHQYDMNGKTLTNVTLITDIGIYSIACEQDLTPYYDGEVTAVAPTTGTIDLYNLPEDIENAQVDVYYTEGSGRQSKKVYAVENTEIVNGTVTLDTDMIQDDEGNYREYTIYITSDNYAQITASVQYSETVYLKMNVPYGDFYDTLNVDETIDVVSTATTSKFKGTTGLAKGTYNDGENICGIVYPVALSLKDYAAAKEIAEKEGVDYDFTGCGEAPAAYLEASVADGAYTFKLSAKELDASELSVTEFTTESSYGNYQITLNGVETAGGVTINGETSNIAGVILTTTDDKTYAMYTLENIWLGTRIDYVQLAWSVKDAPEVYKNHGRGPAFYQYDMNGKTLKNVSVITDTGIYNIPCNQELTPYYASVNAAVVDSTHITVSGMPEDIQNPNASLSYKEGEGRQAKTVTVNTTYKDGVLTLTDSELAEGIVYTVSVSSDNYATVSATVEYKGETSQKPDDGNTTTPDDGNTTTPDDGNTTTPDDGNTTTPDDGNTTTPDDGNTTTPDDGNTTTPDDGNTTTPDDGNTTTPDDGNTTTPDDGNTTTPDDGNTTTPDNGNTTTPDNGNTTTTNTAGTKTTGTAGTKTTNTAVSSSVKTGDLGNTIGLLGIAIASAAAAGYTFKRKRK